MYYLTIETKRDDDTNEQAAQRKGRSFRAVKLAHITADAFWSGGEAKDDDVRPVWISLAGTPRELQAFVMNLRSGRKADLSVAGKSDYSRTKPTRYALLRSAGYVYDTQVIDETASVVTAYLPDLVQRDPGMLDPERCRFVCLTPVWWHEAQGTALRETPAREAGILSHLRSLPVTVALSDAEALSLVPLAARVVSYIEARTRRPIPTDLAFSLQLFIAGLAHGILSMSATKEAHTLWGYRPYPSEYRRLLAQSSDRWLFARHEWAKTFTEEGTAGLLPGVVCDCTHPDLDALLAAQVAIFYGG
ncbi:MAG: hypothetical protein WCG26_12200 [Chloroflexales bacterium]